MGSRALWGRLCAAAEIDDARNCYHCWVHWSLSSANETLPGEIVVAAVFAMASWPSSAFAYAKSQFRLDPRPPNTLHLPRRFRAGRSLRKWACSEDKRNCLRSRSHHPLDPKVWERTAGRRLQCEGIHRCRPDRLVPAAVVAAEASLGVWTPAAAAEPLCPLSLPELWDVVCPSLECSGWAAKLTKTRTPRGLPWPACNVGPSPNVSSSLAAGGSTNGDVAPLLPASWRPNATSRSQATRSTSKTTGSSCPKTSATLRSDDEGFCGACKNKRG